MWVRMGMVCVGGGGGGGGGGGRRQAGQPAGLGPPPARALDWPPPLPLPPRAPRPVWIRPGSGQECRSAGAHVLPPSLPVRSPSPPLLHPPSFHPPPSPSLSPPPPGPPRLPAPAARLPAGGQGPRAGPPAGGRSRPAGSPAAPGGPACARRCGGWLWEGGRVDGPRWAGGWVCWGCGVGRGVQGKSLHTRPCRVAQEVGPCGWTGFRLRRLDIAGRLRRDGPCVRCRTAQGANGGVRFGVRFSVAGCETYFNYRKPH
jgi:hypothetical protein